jgi:hypothetical protein
MQVGQNSVNRRKKKLVFTVMFKPFKRSKSQLYALLLMQLLNSQASTISVNPPSSEEIYKSFFFWGERPCSRSYGRTAALRLIVQPCDEDEEKDNQFFSFFQGMEHWCNEIDKENRSTRGTTCPSATLSTTNPTWTDPECNPGLRG